MLCGDLIIVLKDVNILLIVFPWQRDFTDTFKVKEGLEMGRLYCNIQVDPMESRESLKVERKAGKLSVLKMEKREVMSQGM